MSLAENDAEAVFPERIDTERLLLRKPRQSDAESIFRNYAGDSEVTRTLAWRAHASAADTHAFLTGQIDRWHAGAEAAWVICEPGDPAVWGMITATFRPPRAMIGYVLSRSRWGRGYMPEALRAVADACLSREDTWRVWAYCDVANTRSARVMEKAGLTYEGTLRRWAVIGDDDPVDCRVYARVRDAAQP